MNICAITATKGRHTLLERSVRFFLDQVHNSNIDHEHVYELLIYNNSEVNLELDKKIMADVGGYKRIHLVNQHLDSKTDKPYTNLGAIYNDALKHLPNNCELVYHADDDDIFLPNHISAGVNGFLNKLVDGAAIKAYKPEKSYYRHSGGINLMGNNLEPSIFVLRDHLDEYGYSLTTTEQHLHWLAPLQEKGQLFVDPIGIPTLIYNWGDTQIPTWKTSGDPANPNNFQNYENFSQDHGDGIITPWTREEVEPYYEQIKEKYGNL